MPQDGAWPVCRRIAFAGNEYGGDFGEAGAVRGLQLIDAHVHIERGPYEEWWIEKFIAVAVENGISELYLLEHSHRFIEFNGIYSNFVQHNRYQAEWIRNRMINSVLEYQKLVDKCRKIKFPIIVKFGLEICYEDNCDAIINAITSKFNWDFLTGSVHWVDNWGFDHKKEDWQGKNVDLLYRKYYEKMIRLAKSNLFNHLAHPDSIKCFNYYPETDLENIYTKLANALRDNNVKAEFSSGLFNNYGYSENGLNTKLLKVFQNENVDMITASDAHRPEDVGKGILQAKEFLCRNGRCKSN